jgi:hypothetical protein
LLNLGGKLLIFRSKLLILSSDFLDVVFDCALLSVEVFTGAALGADGFVGVQIV